MLNFQGVVSQTKRAPPQRWFHMGHPLRSCIEFHQSPTRTLPISKKQYLIWTKTGGQIALPTQSLPNRWLISLKLSSYELSYIFCSLWCAHLTVSPKEKTTKPNEKSKLQNQPNQPTNNQHNQRIKRTNKSSNLTLLLFPENACGVGLLEGTKSRSAQMCPDHCPKGILNGWKWWEVTRLPRGCWIERC